MKTLFLLASVSLFFPSQLFAQDSLTVDTLVAYFPFSGNVEDSSGFENHGEVFGATLTKDRFGNPNSAYKFDGFDDFIKSGGSESLKITGDLSLSFWLKVDSFEGFTSGIITYQGSNDDDVSKNALYKINFPNDNSFNYNHEDRNANSNVSTFPNAELENKEWYHVVLTRDTTQKYLGLFVNGALIDTAFFSMVPFGGELSSLRIGENHGTVNSDRFFDGILDDIRIYNYAISDSSILNLYTEGGWPDTEYQEPTLSDTLVAYYPFSGNAEDSSGFENHGEVFGATLTEDRFGNPNSAYEFDGDGDFIEVLHKPVFNSDVKTIGFWFKKTSNEIELEYGLYVEGILWKSFDTGLNREYSFSIENVAPPFDVYNNMGNGTDDFLKNRVENIIESNGWYHIVGIIDSTKSVLYINGKHAQTVDNEGVIINNDAPISIGRASSDSETGRYFKGLIDDIRIYNYAISDPSIWNLYTEGGWPLQEDSTIVPYDTLAAYYPFNGDASDSSGYGNHAEVFGAELTTDRFGRGESAYHFDGNGDFIEIENPEMLHSRKNLSVSFWAKGISQDSSFAGLITKTNMQPFGIAIDNGNRMLFSISDDKIPLNMVVKNLNVDPDEWYQYVAVFNAGEYMRLFQNGTELGTLYGSIPSKMDVNGGSILFGATEIVTETEIDTLFFNGDIDDIRFYNYDLTSIDVSNLFIEESKLPTNNEPSSETPKDFKLHQNYPNPFNPSTTIKFDLPEQSKVTLKVYDITGRLVANLVDDLKSAGSYQVNFDASRLASGIYIYELRTNKFSSIKKFTLIK